jgi:hypothetical protein
MWLQLIIFLALVAGLYYLLNLYLGGNNSYWPKRSVAFVKPGEVGTLFDLIMRKKTVVGMDHEYYRRFKSLGVKFGGIMEARKPVVYAVDPDFIKQILVKDFDHFVDRRKMALGSDRLMNKMLSLLEGQEWKDVRSTMSPTFTTGKKTNYEFLEQKYFLVTLSPLIFLQER